MHMQARVAAAIEKLQNHHRTSAGSTYGSDTRSEVRQDVICMRHPLAMYKDTDAQEKKKRSRATYGVTRPLSCSVSRARVRNG